MSTKNPIGAFSISLAVKDIALSKAFYEKLGFESFGGDINQKWLIMKNGDAIIGLFQGMFDKNIITFNPGWDQNAQPTTAFEDVRQIKQRLNDAGISINEEIATESGPAHITLSDPDGNAILIDQHR